MGYLDILSGGAFANATIFALSITPYITSSIVIQLLTVAIPALERMAKEGEDGRKQLQKITRYTTVGLALLQAFAYYTMLRNQAGAVMYKSGFSGVFCRSGYHQRVHRRGHADCLHGRKNDDYGVGNGISLLLFSGIVSRGPHALQKLWAYFKLAFGDNPQSIYLLTVPLIVVLFLALIVAIIVMTNAERRIPVQYAKKVVGRKMYGGQSTFIPIKVNMSNVMPIIFASSLLAIRHHQGVSSIPTVREHWARFSAHSTITHSFMRRCISS